MALRHLLIPACITLIFFLSAYPLHPDTSYAYSLQAVSMSPVDYPYNRMSHNRIHRYAQWMNILQHPIHIQYISYSLSS